MSGGRFNYVQCSLANEMFNWMSVDYGDYGFSQAPGARKINPLEDRQLSELCWDLLCVIHSYDWYASGDTCEETYRADVKRFKEKWLKPTPQELLKSEIEKSVEELRQDLLVTFLGGVEDGSKRGA